MRTTRVRVAFFVWALVVAPLAMWAFFETIVDSERAAFWIFVIPALVTIAAGLATRRSFIEITLAVVMSATVSWLSVLLALVAACQGTTDCL